MYLLRSGAFAFWGWRAWLDLGVFFVSLPCLLVVVLLGREIALVSMFLHLLLERVENSLRHASAVLSRFLGGSLVVFVCLDRKLCLYHHSCAN